MHEGKVTVNRRNGGNKEPNYTFFPRRKKSRY